MGVAGDSSKYNQVVAVWPLPIYVVNIRVIRKYVVNYLQVSIGGVPQIDSGITVSAPVIDEAIVSHDQRPSHVLCV